MGEDSNLLAAYGTLRRGLARGDAPSDLDVMLVPVGPCLLEGVLLDLGEYPGLVVGPGIVRGELFSMPEADLALGILDEYECYDRGDEEHSLYLRRQVPLVDPDETAWVYLYNGAPHGCPVVASGDWLERNGCAPP